ncbi:hypothetical protein M231_05419 [Tremella mesenterica]|uniref:alpha-1,2-Mannosidase n=1 Tax=Tremella mesenterica TaxID=5217 RepID=A0A4V1M3L4_TREME|nr:hypothetical protein M231_05419 [Tremella mesenterica]
MILRQTAWLFALLTLLLSCHLPTVVAFDNARRIQLREEVRKLFVHGYQGYMKYAYPADNLKPISCTPLGRDPDVTNFGINDISPNASLTLLDVLSTLPLIHLSAFPDAVRRVATEISFDQNVKVQVFEMTIRALGALLSTYQFLDSLPDDLSLQAKRLGMKRKKVNVKQYQARLLDLAIDLANRFKPAFETPSGIPYARINLRHGMDKGESVETCLAGAGSLILEFGVLSRLTGDETYENLAKRAFLALWNRRSSNNLLGNTIGASHGHWLAPGLSGVGAGMDSFFEYSLKASILFADDSYLDVFQDAYAAVQTNVRTPDGFIYRPVQMKHLHTANPSTIDSLSAFLPGLQVLSGDIESAIQNHMIWWNLWRKYSATPEVWAWQERRVEWAGWPLRPEYIESTYYLYQATKDPFYLRVGERVLRDIVRRVKTKCGFAILRNVETGELEDRMESFMLSETLKYLYMLFDPTPLPRLTNSVFTTEGHTLSLPHGQLRTPSFVRRAMHRGENQQCPVYRNPELGGLVVGIERRADYDYARSVVYGPGLEGVWAENESGVKWWEGGFCVIPKAPKWSFDLVLAPSESGILPTTSHSPPSNKIHRDDQTGNFVISDIQGIILTVRWRLDRTGYDVSSIGPHRIRPGQKVYISDPTISHHVPIPQTPLPSHLPVELVLRFSTYLNSATPGETNNVFLHAIGSTATFGRAFSSNTYGWGFISGPVPLIRPIENSQGCLPFDETYMGILLLDRGECSFISKLLHATRAGAAGVIVVGFPQEIQQTLVGEGQGLIRPSAEEESLKISEEIAQSGMIYVDHKIGQGVLKEMKDGVKVAVELLHMDQPIQVTGHEGKVEDEDGSVSDRQKEDISRGKIFVGEWAVHNIHIINSNIP